MIHLRIFLPLLILIVSCQDPKKEDYIKTKDEIISIAKKQNPKYQYTYKLFNLQGNVESVKCTNYIQFVPTSEISNYVTKIDLKLDKKGNVTEETMYLQDNELNYKYHNFFDKFDNLIKTKNYNLDNILLDEREMILNEYGLLVSKKASVRNGSKMVFIETYDYKIITDTLIVYNFYSKPKSSLEGTTTKERYKNNNLISETRFENNEIEKLTFYQYDDQNNLTSINDSIGYDNWEYSYDENNRIIYEKFEYDLLEGVLEKKITYDSVGNIIKEVHYENGKLNEKASYKDDLTYDSKNNWIKRIRYKLDGTKISVLNRKINYYNL